MVVSFLFCYKVMSPILNKNRTQPEVKKSREAFEIIMELSSKNKWCVWITKQAETKLRHENILNDVQFDALMNLINSEKATQGVASFNHVTSTSESAKNISYKGRVIVIVNEEGDKGGIHSNPRIKTITPSEFIKMFNYLLEIKPLVLDMKDSQGTPKFEDNQNLMDSLMVHRFFDGK